ncbi:MAG: 50S ribosomal protein L1 [Thermoplasmatales archaeon]|nr:MAG: 50S ribosomal protein L1 [Thermoplasmatales archaeon]
MIDKKVVELVQKALDESKKLDRKFKQNIDLVINLKNVDLEDAKNRIDEEIILPRGRGKESKIAIFASGELALKAKGKVDLIIKPEEIEDLAKDKKKFKKITDEHDFFIAEAPLMPTIGKTLGVVLGPRGKMPRPIPPHINVTGIVKNLRQTIRLRSKANKTFHAIAGKEEMGKEQIAENIDTIIKRLESKLERGRMNIRSIHVKTTMGPSVRII